MIPPPPVQSQALCHTSIYWVICIPELILHDFGGRSTSLSVWPHPLHQLAPEPSPEARSARRSSQYLKPQPRVHSTCQFHVLVHTRYIPVRTAYMACGWALQACEIIRNSKYVLRNPQYVHGCTLQKGEKCSTKSSKKSYTCMYLVHTGIFHFMTLKYVQGTYY